MASWLGLPAISISKFKILNQAVQRDVDAVVDMVVNDGIVIIHDMRACRMAHMRHACIGRNMWQCHLFLIRQFAFCEGDAMRSM